MNNFLNDLLAAVVIAAIMTAPAVLMVALT
jgi:hypothetical protein